MTTSQPAEPAPQTARTIAMALAASVALIVAVFVTWFYARQEGYVAKVNGEPISYSEFQPMVERQKSQYVQRMHLDFRTEQGKYVLANIQRQAVQHLIEKHLLVQEARKRGITVTAAEVDEKLKEILNRNFGGNQSMMNKAMQQSNLSQAEVRQITEVNLQIDKTIKAISTMAEPTDAELRTYYKKNLDRFKRPEEVKASHILVKTEKEARDILAQIRGGADFATLARRYSLDPGSKSTGGDLGNFGRGRMVPAFEKAAFGLKVGDISTPVKTNYGYHIIKVTDRHKAMTMPFEGIRDQLKQQMSNELQQKRFAEWFESNRKAARIAYAPGFEATPLPPPPSPAAGPQGGPPVGGAPPR